MNFKKADLLHLAVKINKIVQDRCLGVPDNIGRDIVTVIMNHKPGVSINSPAMKVVEAVCEIEQESIVSVISKSRKREIKECRDICVYILHKQLLLTHEVIGMHFSGRHPSTITSALQRIRKKIYKNDTLFLKITKIERALEEKALIHIK